MIEPRVQPKESETTASATQQNQLRTNNPNSPNDFPNGHSNGNDTMNGVISDEEDNSWADEVSVSEDTEKDDYYDQEYDDESPDSPHKKQTLLDAATVKETKIEEEKVEIEAELLDDSGVPAPSKRIIINCYST